MVETTTKTTTKQHRVKVQGRESNGGILFLPNGLLNEVE